MPARSVEEPQASAKGNHDNPVSSNHPGTVTLNTQWNIESTYQYLPGGRGGTGAKFFPAVMCLLHVTGVATFYARCVWRWTKRAKRAEHGGLRKVPFEKPHEVQSFSFD